jgi:aarF domain-containing kinase
VETFEEGKLVNEMFDLDKQSKHDVAMVGLNAILKMVFEDNFVHADLHSGNIICRELEEETGAQSFLQSISQNANAKRRYELSMIDAGITAELQKADRKNFLDLFQAVVGNNGYQVGRLMVERSRHKTCIDIDGFCEGMGKIVGDANETGLSLGTVAINQLLQDVLILCFRHQVKLESRFVGVIIAIGVLEGVGRRLDPDVDVLAVAAPYVVSSAFA